MIGGPVWVPPVNPGQPTGTMYAMTDQWRWERDTTNEYELVIAWAREAIQKAFKNKKLLMDKEVQGNLTHLHPLDLLDYLWRTRSNTRQIDGLIAAAKKEPDVEFDPSEEATNYFAKMEEARYILIELKQIHAATDDDLIRIALLEFEKHEDWDVAAKDFRKLQAAGTVTWEQLKEEIITFETDHNSKQTRKIHCKNRLDRKQVRRNRFRMALRRSLRHFINERLRTTSTKNISTRSTKTCTWTHQTRST